MEAEASSLSSSQEEQLLFESNLPPSCYRLFQGCSSSGGADDNDDDINDDDLLAAEKLAKESGSLTPLVKQELKLLIQIRRLSQGKDELKVHFEQPLSHQLTEAELERRQRRKDQNRRAAKRFRSNKKIRESTLLEEIGMLEGKNQGLRDTVVELKKQKEQLLTRLAGHMVLCPSSICPPSSAPSSSFVATTLSLSRSDSTDAHSAADVTATPHSPPQDMLTAASFESSGLSTSTSGTAVSDYSATTTFAGLSASTTEAAISHLYDLSCDKAAQTYPSSDCITSDVAACPDSVSVPGSLGSTLCPSASSVDTSSLYYCMGSGDVTPPPRPCSTSSHCLSDSASLSPCPGSSVPATACSTPCPTASPAGRLYYADGGGITPPPPPTPRPCSSSSYCASDATNATPTFSLCSPCNDSSGSGGFSTTPLPESDSSASLASFTTAALTRSASATPSPAPSGHDKRTPMLRSATSPYPGALTPSPSPGPPPSYGQSSASFLLQQVTPLSPRPSALSYYLDDPVSPSATAAEAPPVSPSPWPSRSGLCGSSYFVPILLQQGLASRNASYLDVSASPSPSPPAGLGNEEPGIVPSFLQQQQHQQRDAMEASSPQAHHSFSAPTESHQDGNCIPAFTVQQPPVYSSSACLPPSSSCQAAYPSPPPGIPSSDYQEQRNKFVSIFPLEANAALSRSSVHEVPSIDTRHIPRPSSCRDGDDDDNNGVVSGFLQQQPQGGTTSAPALHDLGVSSAPCSAFPPCDDETDGDTFASILLRSVQQSSRAPTSHLDSVNSTTSPTTSSCGNDLNSILPTFLQPGAFFYQ